MEREIGGRGEDGEFGDGSYDVIAACIEVHRHLGPGLLESVYEQSLVLELQMRGMRVETQVELPVVYKGVVLKHEHRLDLVVDDRLIIEVKSVERLIPVHEAQVATYMRITGLRNALLVNFNVSVLTKVCDA